MVRDIIANPEEPIMAEKMTSALESAKKVVADLNKAMAKSLESDRGAQSIQCNGTSASPKEHGSSCQSSDKSE